ncbi:MAG TPA: hypothetical protein VII44_02615 [Puia sp.]
MDINRNNYETFFLLYLDRELGPADMQAVEKFLFENTDLQKEFALLQQTIFLPAEMVFEPKELLLHKEEKRRVVPIYWIRIAASILVMITAGWFILAEVSKNHKGEMARNNQAPVANVSSKKDPVNTVGKRVKTNTDQANLTREKGLTENKNSGEIPNQYKALNQTGDADPGMKNQNDIKEKNNLKQQNPRANSIPDESQLAIQKSNNSLEIQRGEIRTGSDPKQITALAGTQAPALVLTTTISNDQLKYEKADLKEQDFQTENAISIVALNDRNKAITGFFKKLTKHAPDDEKNNARKVRVSVFQFSY